MRRGRLYYKTVFPCGIAGAGGSGAEKNRAARKMFSGRALLHLILTKWSFLWTVHR